MTITIWLYEEILDGAAERVATTLAANPTDDVTVRINSIGGLVQEGLAIYNLLKPRKPIVYIDGLACSMASVIMMAGKRIIAAENSLIMIHDPASGINGNSGELRKRADVLDAHRDAMITAYSRTGISIDKLKAMLTEETWMTAEEALKLGFVDEVAEEMEVAWASAACVAKFNHPPKELLMRNNSAAATAAAATNPSPAGGAQTPDAQAVALAAMRERNHDIVNMSATGKDNPEIQALAITALADPEYTSARFGAEVLAIMARGKGPLNGGAAVDTMSAFASRSHGRNGADLVAAASDLIALRAGIVIDKPHAAVKDISGMSLGDIMHACASRDGRGLGLDYNRRGPAAVKAALSTSDFPAILENSLGKALRAGFATEPATYSAWTRKVLVPDFKEQSRSILGSAPDLLPVAEGAEYKYGSLEEDKSLPYKLGKYGRIVKLTWEALVNDDLNAFMRITQAMGQAAARAEGDVIYSMFAANAGAGPTMQDTSPLFHESHKNLVPAATGLNAAALSAARVLLRRQTAVGGGQLNLTPRYLLVAPELEQAAETLLAAAARGLTTGAANDLVPAWLAQLELVVESRLAADSFYVLTGPDLVDTLERAWLDEDNGPVIEEEDSFNTDAKSYKVRHVFGARWLDWRGAVKAQIVP